MVLGCVVLHCDLGHERLRLVLTVEQERGRSPPVFTYHLSHAGGFTPIRAVGRLVTRLVNECIKLESRQNVT